MSLLCPRKEHELGKQGYSECTAITGQK
uniref:Uncharacterized protein n=1 Tax=Arundo donax TaxID=35708 RepID=A0A0A8YD21_ARUDO